MIKEIIKKIIKILIKTKIKILKQKNHLKQKIEMEKMILNSIIVQARKLTLI